ncbi:MAG: biotin--[acetyl-CoA-carboxylase] ligase [Dehalococcoidia bacterium]|nr:biotin--[acetyl-CoA-carboxylase] ligase [Dehalococcoidia bacterium]
MQSPPFHPALFHSALATRLVGRFFVYRPVVESTMELARREAAEGAPHGTLVLAEEQTAGRGRRGRAFHSPAGENLYFTLVLRLPFERQRVLPVALPLAVCRAIEAAGVDARIKWPNDIWSGERKLCGMLIDAETADGGAIAYPGIGINVNGDPTGNPELRDIATSIARELGAPVKREELLADICNELEAALGMDEAALVAAYRPLNLLLGRAVTVTPAGAGDPYPATAREIAPDGSLIVELPGGGTELLTAAEVSIRPA